MGRGEGEVRWVRVGWGGVEGEVRVPVYTCR